MSERRKKKKRKKRKKYECKYKQEEKRMVGLLLGFQRVCASTCGERKGKVVR